MLRNLRPEESKVKWDQNIPTTMNMSAGTHPLRTLTWLPVVLFSLVVKLQQHQEIDDIRHVVVPLESGREGGVKFVCFGVHSVIL